MIHFNPSILIKVIKKVLIYVTIAISVLLVATTVSVFLFKDRIIQQFVREANKSLNTPIKIGKIEVSAWNDFPNLAIEFTDVYVEDSYPGEYPLLTAKTVSFYLNPIEVWNGTYSIRGLQITGSETNLKINANGENNFTITKKKDHDSTGNIVFNLRNVRIRDARVTYVDKQAHQHHIYQSGKLTASIGVHDDVYEINAGGDVNTEHIGVGNKVFLKNKTFEVSSKLTYDHAGKTFTIHPSSFVLGKSTFEVQGIYSFRNENIIDIIARGKNTNLQTVLSLLPPEVTQKLTKYQSEGEVYFDLKLKGTVSDQKSPFISIRFGCKDTRVFHPDYKSKFEHANLEGSFASASMGDLSRAELFLKNVTGELNGHPFQANFSMENFDNPLVALDFKGQLDAESILNFYPIPEIHELKGSIKADVSFSGKIALLKKKATAQQVKAQGSIELNDLRFATGKEPLRFTDLNGSLHFNNNDLALSNVSGKFEKSDFRLNGFFKNVITFLIFEGQPIGIETDLKADFIDLDRLVAIALGENKSGNFGFSISPNLHLNFNCDVKAMKYKRFKAKNIKGDLLVKNQMAVSRSIHLAAMGGELSLNGIVDAKNPKAIEVVSAFNLKGIPVDSVFYLFQNFDQSFIEAKNLKGQAYADVTLEMTLNEKLHLFPETLIADIGATVKNGELNDFEPMRKLKKYIDDEGLSHLRFADLKNDIHIEKRTIYIPLMEVRSNVTNIQVSGTHTFDQRIDYHVVAPLRNKKKIDSDEAFGAIEEDNTGRPKIFLKITGTTDNYSVSYDKTAVKKKLVKDLKKEVQELKDAFKTKGKKQKKELELEKEEYFDWENN